MHIQFSNETGFTVGSSNLLTISQTRYTHTQHEMLFKAKTKAFDKISSRSRVSFLLIHRDNVPSFALTMHINIMVIASTAEFARKKQQKQN